MRLRAELYSFEFHDCRPMKKKLIVVSSRFPYPVVGGDRLRIFHLCKALSKSYDLTLICLCEKRSELEFIIPIDNVFKRIERIFHSRWSSWISCFFALPTSTPLQVAYYRSSLLAKIIHDVSGEHDAILVHLIRTAESVKNIKLPKFLEMTDAISLNYERVKSTKANRFFDLRKFIYRIEYNRLNAYEKRVVSFFDKSFMVSDIDKQYLCQSNDKVCDKIIVASNGVDFERLRFNFAVSGCDLIFIGNITSFQNLDAAIFLAESVLPLVRKCFPGTKLRLVGRISDEHGRKFSKIEGVEVTGEVDDVSKVVLGGGVGVCPVRMGAGVQNKLLEYMALGLPAVTTSIGLEGLGARHGHELLVGNSPSELADAIVLLLRDRVFASMLASNARIFVESNHSWRVALLPILNAVDAWLS